MINEDGKEVVIWFCIKRGQRIYADVCFESERSPECQKIKDKDTSNMC